jgi:hypothetical protein
MKYVLTIIVVALVLVGVWFSGYSAGLTMGNIQKSGGDGIYRADDMRWRT